MYSFTVIYGFNVYFYCLGIRLIFRWNVLVGIIGHWRVGGDVTMADDFFFTISISAVAEFILFAF